MSSGTHQSSCFRDGIVNLQEVICNIVEMGQTPNQKSQRKNQIELKLVTIKMYQLMILWWRHIAGIFLSYMFSLSAMLALKTATEFFLNFICTWLKFATQQQLLHLQFFLSFSCIRQCHCLWRIFYISHYTFKFCLILHNTFVTSSLKDCNDLVFERQ